MSLSVKIDAHKLEAALQTAPEKINADLHRTLEFAAIDFESAVIDFTPVGVTRHLGQSIAHDVKGSGVSMVGRVYSQLGDQVRVASVEHGSRPHWAPIGPLKAWAAKKLGDERAAYALQRAIAVRGTRAHGMFHRGFIAAAPRVNARIQSFVAGLGRHI